MRIINLMLLMGLLLSFASTPRASAQVQAHCRQANVSLTPNGVATLYPSQIDSGSTSGNTVLRYLRLDVPGTVWTPWRGALSLTCANRGTSNVYLMVEDSLTGAMDSCLATLVVSDPSGVCAAVNAVCQNITVSLTPNGVASIQAAQLNGGSTGNGLQYYLIDSLGRWVQSMSFGCQQLGAQRVQFVVSDSMQRFDTCWATVTVLDPSNACGVHPTPNVVCRNATIYVTPNQVVTLNASQLDGGSTGGTVALLNLSPSGGTPISSYTYTCSAAGQTYMWYLALVDSNGYVIDTCPAYVTVLDTLNNCGTTATPVAVCRNLTVSLMTSGTASIQAAQLNGGSTGSGLQYYLMDSTGNWVQSMSFGCQQIGSNAVRLVVVDSAQRTSFCWATVMVLDPNNACGSNPTPNVVCQNATIYVTPNRVATLNASQLDGGSTGGTVALLNTSPVWGSPANSYTYTCSAAGQTYMWYLAIVDSNGYVIDTCPAYVTVIDTFQYCNPTQPCVDTSRIDSSVFCPQGFMPVCGCDGQTYANACEAENYYGITRYTYGACANGSTFSASAQVQNVSCGGTCDAEVTIRVMGNHGVCTFAWSDGYTSIDSVRSNLCDSLYVVQISDSTGQTFSLTIAVGTAQGCVWPGDTDDNTVVNYFDVLSIALTHGETGFVRPNASLAWVGQPAQDWNTVNPIVGLPNYKHIDANGDGIINQNDMTAIVQNYGQSYYRSDASLLGTLPFYVGSLTARQGDRISLPIVLGSATEVPTNVYGVAFTINYDPSKVQAGSVSADFSGSWLGNDLLTFERVDHNQGKIEVTVARKDRMNVTNYGALGQLNLTIRDDILRRSGTEYMDLNITNVRLIDNGNQIVGTNRQTGLLTIEAPTSVIEMQAAEAIQLKLYPNPTRDAVQLQVEDGQIDEIMLFNSLGQQVLQMQNLGQSTYRLSLGHLPAGVYRLQVRQGNQTLSKAVVKQ